MSIKVLERFVVHIYRLCTISNLPLKGGPRESFRGNGQPRDLFIPIFGYIIPTA